MRVEMAVVRVRVGVRTNEVEKYIGAVLNESELSLDGNIALSHQGLGHAGMRRSLLRLSCSVVASHKIFLR